VLNHAKHHLLLITLSQISHSIDRRISFTDKYNKP